MATTMEPAKYTPPHLPEIVRRNRLIQSLAANDNCRIVQVVGQAAQGKSTLVADYLRGIESDLAWMTLDVQDGDLSNFFDLFVSAIAKAQRRDSDAVQPPPAAKIELGSRTNSARYRARIQSIIDRINSPLCLVIDSLENIETSAPAFELIKYLIGQTTKEFRLFLISRHVLELRLQELKVKREAFFLNNAELAFTHEEIRCFLELFHGVSLPKNQLEQIFSLTGGWVGGLVLISQALLPLPPDKWNSILDGGLPEDLREETLAYFSEVVFSRQPPHIREFLVKTSIFDSIDPEIAGAFTEVAQFRSLFETLIRANLFTQAFLGSDQKTYYRYNHLFRDFLRSRFESTFSGSEKKRMYILAGDLYSRARKREKAAKFFIRAEEYHKAGEAIKRIGTDMSIRGHFQDLERLLACLPKNLIEQDPWLLLFLTLTRRTSGGKRNLSDFKACLQRFRLAGDNRGQILTLAYLIEAGIFVEHDLNEMQAWLAEAEKLLRKLSQVPYYTYARTLLWLQIGFGYISGGIDVTRGLSACENAYLMASAMGETTLRTNAQIISVLGHATTGEFSRAEKKLRKIAPILEQEVYPEYGVLQNLVDIELRLKKGDLENIDALLERVREDIETFGLLFLYPGYLHALGQVCIFQGRYDRAMKTLGHLWDVSVLSGNCYHQGLAQRLEAMVLFRRGRYEEAFHAARDALESMTAMGPETLQLMRTRLLLGLICLNLGKLDRAETQFQICLEFFRKNSHRLSATETFLGLALLARGKGLSSKIPQFLEQGFRLATRHGFKHFSLLTKAELIRIQKMLDTPALFRFKEFAGELVGNHGDDSDDLQLLESAENPSQSPMTQGFSGIGAAHDSGSQQLFIQTLGGFHVRRGGGGPIEHRQWGGKRQKLLLKSIVVHGAREVPTEIVIDNIWPESKTKAAQRNLKVALHRLRKVLEPDLDPKSGSIYVHLKDNLISLDRELCRVDVDEFLYCRKEARRRENRSDIEKLRGLCHRAVELYQGDFLPEEPYEPWIEMKRLALRDEFINAIFELVEIYRNKKELDEAARCCQKVIQLEPNLERATRELMKIYADQGRRGEALKVYDNLERCLMTDIGVAPDKATITLLENIRCQ